MTTSTITHDTDSKQKTSVFKFEKPGPLRHEMQLSLNTFEAQLLFIGNSSKKSIGLLRFSSVVSLLWEASSEDDPYADYYLWRVHQLIRALSDEMISFINEYELLISKNMKHPNLQVKSLSSAKPVTHSLWFKTPYGYLATGLIADLDCLLCLVLTAYRMGVLSSQSFKQLRDDCSSRITELFKLPLEWYPLGLTRIDVFNKTELGQEAERLMGVLPEGILTQEIRSFLAPDIKNKTHKIAPIHNL